MDTATFHTEAPRVETGEDGLPVIAGSVMFRGRAADAMLEGLPTRPIEEFTECPFEALDDPQRVHLDAYGDVHLCQGLLMGTMWETPLAELVAGYDPQAHPVVGPLLRGGPVRLRVERECEAEPATRTAGKPEYVSACHLCYEMRKALLYELPEYLGPEQIYGL